MPLRLVKKGTAKHFEKVLFPGKQNLAEIQKQYLPVLHTYQEKRCQFKLQQKKISAK